MNHVIRVSLFFRPVEGAAPEQDKIAVKLATGLIQLYEPHIQKLDITVNELMLVYG